MSTVLVVAAGGALGAVARYLMMAGVGMWLGAGFPYGTLAVNVLGSIVFGALVEMMALVWNIGGDLRAFLVIGILGSFTTFSAFSLDAVVLFHRGDLVGTALYVLGSVVLAVVGFMAGMAAVRLAV
ncbi:MAG: fluoride efflux transporter CrcB [Pseudomonadota bacterium]|nr:fluoride efflux transporter CrcB [Pseudomonadota bacterium]